MTKIDVIPIIPSLNPDEKMIIYVKGLIKKGFKKIIVINDGSSKDYDKYFEEVSKQKECILLKHVINQGKGRALKTGFNYYLENFSKDYSGVITADSDGQHSPTDTYKIAEKLMKNKNSLVLGTRDFNDENIPARSVLGNKTTTFIFKLLNGKKITDTQTGLRGIPNNFIENCLRLQGEKYEYEINMLISAVKENINIIEETIETIYIENNSSSHFNPIRDSYRIYKVILTEFFKFAVSGLLSFIIDIVLFYVFSKVFGFLNSTICILLSTIIARVISSLFNYIMNKNMVFNSNKGNSLLIKYYTLCIIQMFISGILVSGIYFLLPISKTIWKVFVDIILFFLSYSIQKNVIFKGEDIKC